MKRLFLIILLFSILLTTSCNINDANVNDRIVSPTNNTSPLEGKWIIKNSIEELEEDEVQVKEDIYINQEILFHKDGVVIGAEYSTNPSYKVKYVNSYDYLLYKFKTTPNNLGIEDEKILVITILNDNKYFYEFIKYGEDKLLVNIEESFYNLEKIANEVSIEEIDRYINVEKTMIRNMNTLEMEELNTGVLLGLKIPSFDEKNKLMDWEYKTIWINSQNKDIKGIYELDDLLVPRKNGFWMVKVNREKDIIIKDQISATPLFKVMDSSDYIEEELDSISMSMISPIRDSKNPSVLKNILFLGNDYISVEKIDNTYEEKKTLEVYAIDNIEDKPIKLSDLIGADGKTIFKEGALSIGTIGAEYILNEENVGLIRKSGYWTIKGRVNYRQNNEELYKDFNIKAIPPKEMISYDSLSIQWNAIKMSIPEALDVFSSPNNEFIVVVTLSHLLIYNIEDGSIGSIPSARIKLPYNASVIMSEWAVGRYVNIWQNEVLNNNGSPLTY